MSRPSVKLKQREGIFESSSYRPSTKEMIILDTPSKAGSLYHEYRYYLQFENLPNWIIVWANLGLVSTYPYLFMVFILQVFHLKWLMIGLSLCYLLFVIPVYFLELDANIFAAKRIFLKNRSRLNYISLIISLITYTFSYIYFPIYMIQQALL